MAYVKKCSYFLSSLDFTCLTVSSWLYSGCMCVICALSVSYQQVYVSYPIICIKMHKTYKCGLTNNITQVAIFRLRMLCGFMPILVLTPKISGPILCYALEVPRWSSFYNANFFGYKVTGSVKHDTRYLNSFILECFGRTQDLKIVYPNGLGLVSRACMSQFVGFVFMSVDCAASVFTPRP